MYASITKVAGSSASLRVASGKPKIPKIECPSNFGDLLTDFNCYVSIVRWLIARPLPPSRERSVQDYPSYPRK